MKNRPAPDDLIECHDLFGQIHRLPRRKFFLRPSAYGLVVHENRLLTSRVVSSGKLQLPGGAVEPGESLAQALSRETLEETGIQIEVGALCGYVEDFFYYAPRDKAMHTLGFFYHCRPLSFKLAQAHEIQDYEVTAPRWTPVDELRLEDWQNFGPLIMRNLDLTGDTLAGGPHA
jgi:8-oxo-dGTP pyrophosphatase MutT (NUDIX family)